MARGFWSTVVTVALVTVAVPVGPVAQGAPPVSRPRCTIVGTAGDDVLAGTKRADVICGKGGDDRLVGRGGKDVLDGGTGNDVMLGGPGNDTFLARDSKRFRDVVRCGSGTDSVTADRRDRLAADCEKTNQLWPPSDLTLTPSSVAENSPAGTVVGLLAAVDPDRGDTHTFQLVPGTGSTDNASFAVVGHTLRTAVGLDFETDPVLSVRIRATDSTGLRREEALTVTVTDVPENAAPVALDDTFPGTEDNTVNLTDSGPGSPAANDTDADGDALTVTAVSNPVGGTVSLAGGTIQVVPDADVCGPTAVGFDYTVSDGLGGTDTGHVTIDLTCVTDPVVAADDAATVAEDDDPTAVPVLANEDNPDGASLTIQSATDPANGSVAITGGGTGLTYEPDPDYCNDPPGGTPDTFSYTLDQGGTTADVDMTVTCVDDAPVAVDDAATVFEGTSATAVPVLANDTDVDAGTLTIADTSDPADGTVVVTGSGTGLTYEPDPAYCNDPPGGTPDTFTYTLNGGSTATVSVTVTCDDPPTAVDDATTVAEDPGAVAVDVLGNDANADGGPLSVVTTSDPAHGTVVITGGGSGLTYEPDPDYCNDPPGVTPDTFTYTLNGGSTATVAMTVTCADDPAVAADDAATVAEDAAATDVPVLANDTDVDGGGLSVVTTSDPAHGTVVVTGGGAGLTYQPDPDYCNAPPGSALDTFTYTLVGGDEATVTMTVTCVNDAPVADDETFTGTLSAVGNTALVVDDPVDAAPSLGGAKKVVSGAILAGDSDADGPGPLTVVPGTFATNDGGSVTIEDDGDFTFVPAAGTSCTDTSDTFVYTVSDQAAPTPGTDTGLVTISITGCVWYVDNAAAGNAGTSVAPFDTLAQAEAASAAGDVIHVADGDDTTTGYASGIVLKAGQWLVGTAVDLLVGDDLLLAGVPAARPTLTAVDTDVVTLASGAIVSGLDVDPQGTGGGIFGGGTAGGTISDVGILDTGTPGLDPGLDLDATTGTTVLEDLTVVTSGAVGVRIANAGTVVLEPTGTISITTAGARGLAVTDTALGTSVIDDVTVTGSGSGAVLLSGTSGSTTFTDLDLATTSSAVGAFVLSSAGSVTVPASGAADVSAQGGPAVDVTATPADLAFDDVSSSGSSGSGVTLSGLGAGTFSAATGAVSGAGGAAFVVAGASSGDITFPGPIGDGTGNTVSVTGRTGGTVTLSGDLTDGPDAAGGIAVSGNSGGTTVFSGATKSFSTGAGAGVSLASNAGHTVSFTNGGLAITSTSGGGLLSSGGGTLEVTGAGNTVTTGTGGALLIDNTTIGAGNATFQSVTTNGATVGIRANNTGVVGRLIITGAGGTCVSGDASGCSGGELANGPGADDGSATPGGAGIVLNSTLNPSFTRMWVHDFTNYAVRGTSVAGFTLANSLVNGDNGTNGTTPFFDSSLRFDNLTGSASVSDTFVAGGFGDNMRVVNTSGSLNRITLTGVTFGVNGARPANDALLLESEASAGQLQATITGSTFASAAGDLLQLNHGGTGTGDLVLTGNTFSDAHPSIATGGGGVSLFQSGVAGGNTTMTITGNTFRDAVGPGVLVVKGSGPATQTGTFGNNAIGVDGVANSGSQAGSALKLQLVSQGTSTWSVTDNTIRGYNNFGIEVLAGGGGVAATGTFNTTVTGNDVAQPGTAAGSITIPKQGIHYNIGTVPGDTFQACADVRSNAISSSGADASPATGVDVDVRLRQRQATTIRLPGYAGATNDNSAVQAFVNANNSPGTTTLAANTVPTGGGYVGTGTTCP